MQQKQILLISFFSLSFLFKVNPGIKPLSGLFEVFHSLNYFLKLDFSPFSGHRTDIYDMRENISVIQYKNDCKLFKQRKRRTKINKKNCGHSRFTTGWYSCQIGFKMRYIQSQILPHRH